MADATRTRSNRAWSARTPSASSNYKSILSKKLVDTRTTKGVYAGVDSLAPAQPAASVRVWQYLNQGRDKTEAI
jgi:hypothetical protein